MEPSEVVGVSFHVLLFYTLVIRSFLLILIHPLTSLHISQNIALLTSATAWQSPTSSGTPPNSADRAIDGTTSGVWDNGSVTDTGYQEAPSWHVTWPAAHRITRIKVWNRTDCCGERIISFVLTVFLDGNKMWSSAESTVETSTNKEMYDFIDIPSHIYGDKVEVKLFETTSLSLAEVQVFGLSGV